MSFRVFSASACFAVIANMVFAQQDVREETIRDINTMINSVSVQMSRLEDRVFKAEEELSEWQARVESNRSNAFDRARESNILSIGTEIADHPMALFGDPACQDEFAAAGLPGVPFDEQRLTNCAADVRPIVRYPAGYECSRLNWEFGVDGDIALTGYVKTEQDLQELAKILGPSAIQDVTARPFPVCATLTTLELPLTSDLKPKIRMLGGNTTIPFGNSLAFEVETPDFYAFLYVVYLQADGSVVNLMPRRRLFRQQQDPLSILRFGDGIDGRQTYTATDPPGTEAIIVVAARSPIVGLDDLEDPETGQFFQKSGPSRALDQIEFLEILEDSLDDMFDKGLGKREVSAGVLHVTVIP